MRKQGNLTQDDINAKVEYLYTHRANHTIHAYIDITGDLVAGTLLSQIMYWFSKGKNNEVRASIYRDGHYWIAKRREDWYGEIRVSPKQYDRAISMLAGKIKVDGKEEVDESKRFVEVKKFHFNGIPTTHIRPITENINKAISAWKQNLADEIANTNCRVENVNLPNVNIENADGEVPNIPKVNMEVNEKSNSYNIYNNINNIDTENTTDNTIREYNSEITKEEKTLTKVNAKVQTSLSERKQMPKSAKQRYLDMKSNEIDMLNRAYAICYENYDEPIADEIYNTIEHYFAKYTEKTDKIHPILTDNTLRDIIERMANFSDTEYEHFERVIETQGQFIKAVDAFFDTDFGSRTGYQTNWNLPHFMSDGVLDRLMQRIAEY